jgi:SulP family sulfate permease
LLYALFGTSRALAVGPVAVASLMTAAAIGSAWPLQEQPAYWEAAITLAFLLGGVMLMAMGCCAWAFWPTSSATL